MILKFYPWANGDRWCKCCTPLIKLGTFLPLNFNDVKRYVRLYQVAWIEIKGGSE